MDKNLSLSNIFPEHISTVEQNGLIFIYFIVLFSLGGSRDMGLIPGLGKSPGGGHGNRLQYSCLENPMNTGAWRADSVHGVRKSGTQLSD